MRPRLIYDGDCGFCRYTVDYAATLTGDAVDYQPYQRVAGEYPEIPLEAFAGAIQLLEDGQRSAGAAAAFRVMEIGGRRSWMRLYRRLPGFAGLCEWLYAWVARHRAGCLRWCRLVIGPRLRPAHHQRVAGLLTRGISLCSLAAFASLWWQVEALLGPDGVLPVDGLLRAVSASYGSERYLLLPTLLWAGAGSVALQLLCFAGSAAALLGVAGRWTTVSALVQYVCYLSLLHGGQLFLGYQWDVLLLECLVVAAVLGRAPGAGVWVARLLLLRFMFLAGLAKLASGDPTWWTGSALDYHFETQPLPTVLAWYAQQLPGPALRAATYATLVIELVLPFFILGPRRLRLLAAPCFVALELFILVTGSYNFFNLLTLVLCLCLLDDADLPGTPGGARRGSSPAAGLLAGALIALGILQMAHQVGAVGGRGLLAVVRPWAVASPYGLFAVMTTQRQELIIEGTRDGERWLPYHFPFKPGDIQRRPVWAAPHQPRLDWQLWFAALDGPERADWVYELVNELLEANPQVLRLVQDPFAGQRPRAVRIVAYRYRFSTPAERAASGAWWVRDGRREWLPPMRLRRPLIRHQPLELD